MAQNQPISREVRRSNSNDTSASEEDVKIALEMEKNGTPIPESLKSAVEEYKTKNNAKDEKDKDPKEEQVHDAPEEVDDPENEDEPKDPAEGDEGEDKDKDNKQPTKEKKPDDEGNKKQVVPEADGRPVRVMPIKKFDSIKKGWKEREDELVNENSTLKTELDKLRKAQEEGSQKKFEERASELANKIGMDQEDLKSLIDFLKGEVKLPDEVLKKIQNQEEQPKPKEDDDKEFWKKQDDQFDSEFESALKEPGADKDMAKYKDKIKDLAFTDGYNTKSIWELWTRFIKPKYSSKKAPPENPDGVTPTGEEMDWEEIAKDPAKIKALSIENAEKFQTYMANKNPRQIRRPGR